VADDPRGLRLEIHEELCELIATYRFPPMPENAARKVKASAMKILDGIMLRSFEQTSSASLS
jgi:hypothetical protein